VNDNGSGYNLVSVIDAIQVRLPMPGGEPSTASLGYITATMSYDPPLAGRKSAPAACWGINPKRAAYNRTCHRTTFGLRNLTTIIVLIVLAIGCPSAMWTLGECYDCPNDFPSTRSLRRRR
jgi:hypothetical protein